MHLKINKQHNNFIHKIKQTGNTIAWIMRQARRKTWPAVFRIMKKKICKKYNYSKLSA